MKHFTIHDRDYQTEAVGSIWSYFRHFSGNPIVAMPTGTGKSVVIARFLQSVFATYPNQKILVLTHVKELIKQNYEKLLAAWSFAPAGVYSAGLNEKDHTKAITFGGIASVAKKWALFGHVDLVIIDEVHLVSTNEDTMYRSFLTGLYSINPNLKVIGFTATPWRLGHGHLTDPVVHQDGSETPSLFSDVCFDITGMEAFNRLIAEGYLLPLIPKRTNTVLSVDGVHMRGGEYIEKELQTAVDKDEITEAALREAIEYGANRHKWLIFASGTEHADHIAEMLNGMGIPTGCVHSKREGRDKTIEDFKAGRLRAVVNNNVLTTGFDETAIDLIVCLRPTASTVLWVQMLGRGTRPHWAEGDYDLNDMGGRLASIAASHKQNCLVLDYARNSKKLGPVNDPVVPRRKGQGGGTAPIKECPTCGSFVHASLRFCNGIMFDGTACTHEFVFDTKLKQSASSDALVKGDLPIVEMFAVDHITVRKHERQGAPPMIKVSYYVNNGFQVFDEYVCVEHTNYAAKKARDWWRARSSTPMPTDVTVALEEIVNLPQATHLRVWVNKASASGRGVWPEIMSVCFDGTAFKTQEVADSFVPPPIARADAPRQHAAFASDSIDDDIPF